MMARCPWLKFPEEGNEYAIWEPACGEGHMSEVFKEAGAEHIQHGSRGPWVW